MGALSTIDLHPENIPGGADQAVRACRAFLDKALASGHREVRVITGLGLRGDGTPRLRARIEQEVLHGFFSQIEHSVYEQGGAVIHLWLKAGQRAPGTAWHRGQRLEVERRNVADREERFMVAWDRLAAAEKALEEGDLRRCRLKLNQVRREFGWETVEGGLSVESAADLLDDATRRLKALDA
ncbi:MAG: Smr/MutS family protein [bacterium]